jgi:hypothetical protein
MVRAIDTQDSPALTNILSSSHAYSPLLNSTGPGIEKHGKPNTKTAKTDTERPPPFGQPPFRLSQLFNHEIGIVSYFQRL